MDQEISQSENRTVTPPEKPNRNGIFKKHEPPVMPLAESQATTAKKKLTQVEGIVSRVSLSIPRQSAPEFARRSLTKDAVDFTQTIRGVGRSITDMTSAARTSIKLPKTRETAGSSGLSLGGRIDRLTQEVRDSSKLRDTLSAITASTAVSAMQFNKSVTATFMRKSLSLSYQQVGIAKAMLSLTGSMADMIEAKLEAIKLNTAAPETSKASILDRLKSEIRAQLVKDKATKIISVGRNTFNRFAKEPVMNQIENLRDKKGLSSTLSDIRESASAALKRAGKSTAAMARAPVGAPDSEPGVFRKAIGKVSASFNTLGDRVDALKPEADRAARIDAFGDNILSRIPGFYRKAGEEKPSARTYDTPILTEISLLSDIKQILEDWPKCGCPDGSGPGAETQKRKSKAPSRKSEQFGPFPDLSANPELEAEKDTVPPQPKKPSRFTKRFRIGKKRVSDELSGLKADFDTIRGRDERYGPYPSVTQNLKRAGASVVSRAKSARDDYRLGKESFFTHLNEGVEDDQKINTIGELANASAASLREDLLGKTDTLKQTALETEVAKRVKDKLESLGVTDKASAKEFAKEKLDAAKTQGHDLVSDAILKSQFEAKRANIKMRMAQDKTKNQILPDIKDKLVESEVAKRVKEELNKRGITDAESFKKYATQKADDLANPLSDTRTSIRHGIRKRKNAAADKLDDVVASAEERYYATRQRVAEATNRFRNAEGDMHDIEHTDEVAAQKTDGTLRQGWRTFVNSYKGKRLNEMPEAPSVDYVKGTFRRGMEEARARRELREAKRARNHRLASTAADAIITKPIEGAGAMTGILLKQSFSLFRDLRSILKKDNSLRERQLKKAEGPRKNSWSDYLRRLDHAHEEWAGKSFDAGVRGGRWGLLKSIAAARAAGGLLSHITNPMKDVGGGMSSVIGDMFAGTLLGKIASPLWTAAKLPFQATGSVLRGAGTIGGAVAKGLYTATGASSLLSGVGGAAKFGMLKGIIGTDLPLGILGGAVKNYSEKNLTGGWKTAGKYGGAALEGASYGMMLGGPVGAAIGAPLMMLIEYMGGLGNTLKAAGHIVGEGFSKVGAAADWVFHGLVGRHAKVRPDGTVISKGHDGIIGETLGYIFGSKEKRTRSGQVYQDGKTGALPWVGNKVMEFFKGKKYSNGERIQGTSGLGKMMDWMSEDHHLVPQAKADTLGLTVDKNGHLVSSAGAQGGVKNPSNVDLSAGTYSPKDPSMAVFGWEKVTGQLAKPGSPYQKFAQARMDMYGIKDMSMLDYVVSMERLQESIYRYPNHREEFSESSHPTELQQSDYAYMASRFGFDAQNKDAVSYFISWYQKRFIPVLKAGMAVLEPDKVTFKTIYAAKGDKIQGYVNGMKQMLMSVLSGVAGLEPDPATYAKYVAAAAKQPKGRAAAEMKPTALPSPLPNKEKSGPKIVDVAEHINPMDDALLKKKYNPQAQGGGAQSKPNAMDPRDAFNTASMALGDVTDQPEYKAAFAKLTNTVQKRVSGSRALQFVLWSSSVQHHPDDAAKIFEVNYNAKDNDEVYIKKIYQTRSTRFIDQSAQNRSAAFTHISDEMGFAEDIASGKTQATFDQMAAQAGKAIRPMGDATYTRKAAMPTPKEQKARAEQAYKFFISRGWSPQAAAGIIANIRQESQFNPDASGDGGAAYGLGQWHKDRQMDIFSAKGKRLQDMDFEEQLDAYDWELKNGKNGFGSDKSREALKNAKTANEAGAIVSKYFERPGQTDAIRAQEAQNRGASADVMFSEMSKTGDGGGATQVASASTPGSDGGDTQTSAGSVTSPTTTSVASAAPADDGSTVTPKGAAPVEVPASGPQTSVLASNTTPTQVPMPASNPLLTGLATQQSDAGRTTQRLADIKPAQPVTAVLSDDHKSIMAQLAETSAKTNDLLAQLVSISQSTSSAQLDVSKQALAAQTDPKNRASVVNIAAPMTHVAQASQRSSVQGSPFAKESNPMVGA